MSEPTPEQKAKAAIELANAYRDMMGMFAWKHFTGVVLENIRKHPMDTIDAMEIKDLTVAHVAEGRGIRKCIEAIKEEINWILNGATTR